jgi:hypothetical protein
MSIKLFLQITCTVASVLLVSVSSSFAAQIVMEAPTSADTTRQPYTILVYIDPQNETVSGVAGTLSFPTDLFEVDTISTVGGVVPMWMTRPHVPQEKYFDDRTHITFEGIMPGGFSGVRSPYYEGVRRGLVFTVKLIPKNKGTGNLVLDNIEIRAFDDQGTLLSSEGSVKKVSVPMLSTGMPKNTGNLSRIYSPTLITTITRNELVSNNAWYVDIHEDSTVNSVDHIEIAESESYDPEHLPLFLWRTQTTPYILQYQSRSMYVHIKVVYTNKTYALQTLQPVENSSNIFYLSRILVSIIISTLLLYRYGKNFLHLITKFKRLRT